MKLARRRYERSGLFKLPGHPHAHWPIPLALLVLIFLSCNLPGIAQRATPDAGQGPAGQPTAPSNLEQDMSLEEALAISPEDHRPQVLKQMGPPDTFRIAFVSVNGQPLRQEEWSYLDDNTRFDFVDGTLVWTLALEPMPETYLSAPQYDPLSFTADLTVADVQALLQDQELFQADMADTGVDGGLVMAGDQLLLGFDQGRLISVESFALAPEASS